MPLKLSKQCRYTYHSYRIRYCVDWYIDTSISEELATSIIMVIREKSAALKKRACYNGMEAKERRLK